MSNRVVELVARISADVAGDVTGSFDDVGGAARAMGDDVERSTSRAADHVGKLGSASEGLDDKFGRAAGAAGALSSGADLIGNEKASVALQAMALATDFFSGVGQVGILVTEGLSVATVENEAATVSQTIAQKAAAVATKAWAIAQGALNAVMSGNPVALVVIAVIALVAAVILAYKHSETFRNIVQGVMRAAAGAVHQVVDAVGDVVGWVVRLGDKFDDAGRVVHAYAFVVKTEIGIVVGVLEWVGGKVDDAGRKWTGFKNDAVDAARTIADKGAAFFHALFHPIDTARKAVQDLLDLVGDLIDKLTHIHLPDLPHIPGLGRGIAPGAGGSVTNTIEVTVDMPVTLTLPVAGDPNASAQAIVTALQQLANRLGITILDLLQQNGVVTA